MKGLSWLKALVEVLPHAILTAEGVGAPVKMAGSAKRSLAITLATTALAVAGHLPVVQQTLPVINLIGALVDATVAELNSAGDLPKASAAPSPAASAAQAGA